MGGGLTPNETLSHSNGKFVFDHGPNPNKVGPKSTILILELVSWKVMNTIQISQKFQKNIYLVISPVTIRCNSVS